MSVSRVPSNRKVNGKALTADITLTPKDIGTLNSVTMSFSGGAGWFKLATVTMPQASSIVYIALIGGAGHNVGSPHQAGISELVLRAGNGNPKGITGALWKRTAVGLTNFAWINTSGDTYDIYVEIGNYATSVNIHWDCTANASVSVYTSPTYSASKPSSVTYGVVYTMYSSHQKPTPSDIGALPTTGGTVSGPLSVTGGLTGSLNGNASTATKLQTARSIGGVVFDGSANINLPGVTIVGNETQLNQVILNIGVNAIHAIGHETGEIEVSAILLDKKDLDPDLPIGNENAWDQDVRIDIRDNGCGMSPDVLKQIFDPFFTTKKGGKGTGLGLALTEQIVTSHRGVVNAESAPGVGSVFHLYFPASVPDGNSSFAPSVQDMHEPSQNQ